MATRPFTILLAAAAFMAAGLAAAADYQPQKRMRTAYDNCLKNEVGQGAWCVQKCQAGFKMSGSGPTARCTATSPNARYRPPEPTYKPQPANPNAPKVPGA